MKVKGEGFDNLGMMSYTRPQGGCDLVRQHGGACNPVSEEGGVIAGLKGALLEPDAAISDAIDAPSPWYTDLCKESC